MPSSLTLFLAVLLLPTGAHAHRPDAVGGGFADSGLLGSYFSNPDLKGQPSFVRRDVRVDFDWGETLPVGGSTAEPYSSFPIDGFSVRWEGRILARFGEPYVFVGSADDGVRIKLKKAGESAWTILVDRWETPGSFESAPYDFVAGVPYEIQVEYREKNGTARCVVAWQSPSTPREVIDPVTQQGLNAASFANYVWANLMKTARYGKKREAADAQGWPTEDGTELIMAEWDPGDPQLSGTYLVRFQGQARVRKSCCTDLRFVNDEGAFEDTLPKGAGYNPQTNTTSTTMQMPGSRTFLFFEQTARSAGDSGNGVTQIELMRPLSPGSARHHRHDEVVYRPFKEMLRDGFTTVRWLEGANEETEIHWADRALPGSAFFRTRQGQENWEYLVMLSNETGKDLYITTPVAADDEYYEKLALLLRYGSDGREPYREPTANPKYPPLNPNLRVYVEVGNEIWNWSFDSTTFAQRLAMGEAQRDSSLWKAINFDGNAGKPDEIRAIRRWHAMRSVACSKAFRRVWGDDAMGTRARILLEYQYDDFQGTAGASLFFVDEYLGNRGGQYVADPQSVSHFFWGGGGATYYGLANKTGSQTGTVLRDASFETPAIAAGTRKNAPSGSPWAFRGTAGIVRPKGEGRVKELDRVTQPTSGQQVAFIRGRGSISQRVRFSKAGEYAIAFQAAGSGSGWPAHLSFDIFVDDVKVSPRDQNDILAATGDWHIGGWLRRTDSFEEEWGSVPFWVDGPGERTIRFVGRGGQGYVLLDDVRIMSADALLESGFDAGEAEGQVGDANLKEQFRSQAKYARTFGLQVVAYEAGWSVGGDFHQVPLQNWTKLEDERAEAINDRVIELWDESGSFMSVWGVYRYWPDYDLGNAAKYPIMRSFTGASERLRAEAGYGSTLPATLGTDDASWAHRSEGGGSGSWWHKYVPWSDTVGGSEWFSWMLVAPSSRQYSVRVRAAGEGTLTVELDGEVLAHFDTIKTPLPLSKAFLARGAHAVRVVITGDVELRGVDIE